MGVRTVYVQVQYQLYYFIGFFFFQWQLSDQVTLKTFWETILQVLRWEFCFNMWLVYFKREMIFILFYKSIATNASSNVNPLSLSVNAVQQLTCRWSHCSWSESTEFGACILHFWMVHHHHLHYFCDWLDNISKLNRKSACWRELHTKAHHNPPIVSLPNVTAITHSDNKTSSQQ